MHDDRRVLPHAPDAEASILGGILLKPSTLGQLEALEVEDFFDHRHKVVFQAIRNVAASRQPVDVVTIGNEIARSGRLEAIGGIGLLGELALHVPTADNVATYARIVREKHALRKLMVAAGDIAEKGYNFEDDAGEFIAESVGTMRVIEQDYRAAAGLPRGFLRSSERIDGEREQRLESAGRAMLFHNSFLDDRLRALLPHDLVIVTAKTGRGKTEIALDIAARSAMSGKRVAYFALEAEPLELERRRKYRWIVGEVYRRKMPYADALDYPDWLLGKCEHIVGDLDAEADEWYRATFSTLHTFYKEGQGGRGRRRFDVAKMADEMLTMAPKVDLIVLDHLHYVDAQENQSEFAAQSRIAHTLRDIALDVGKPVIAVAHLRKSPPGSPLFRALMPDEESIHGHSDLSKITTQIVALAPAPFIDPPKWFLSPTLIGVVKDRRGGKDNLAALTYFDTRFRTYSQRYTLGRLVKGDTEWEALAPGDVPRWARGHHQLELAVG